MVFNGLKTVMKWPKTVKTVKSFNLQRLQTTIDYYLKTYSDHCYNIILKTRAISNIHPIQSSALILDQIYEESYSTDQESEFLSV